MNEDLHFARTRANRRGKTGGGNIPIIPERFRKAVSVHLYRNFTFDPSRPCPLILGIDGPSGEGKTYQCAKLLAALGVRTINISAGELEHPDAGQPARIIRDRYLEASLRRKSELSVLVINDLDVGIGDWGELVQYTVNRQNVFGELMNLADSPRSVGGELTRRVPLIVTGNDFTHLYRPLVRFGRMRNFTWKPTDEEKFHVVRGIFHYLSENDIDIIFSSFPEQPLSFFADLHASAGEEHLWSLIRRNGESESFQQLLTGQHIDYRTSPDPEEIIQIGRMLEKSKHLSSHVEKGIDHGENAH